jgi:hypothetical protein
VSEVLARPELADRNAVQGRVVQVTVPVRIPYGINPAARSSALARARQAVAALFAGATTSLDDRGDVVDVMGGGALQHAYPSTYALRSEAWRAVENAPAGLTAWAGGFGPEDVGVTDFTAPAVPRSVSDETGFHTTEKHPDVNPDGTLDYGEIVHAATGEGLHNVGTALGSIGKGVGEGVASAAGGFFSGLGWKGTIVLIALVAIALLVLALHFGGAALFVGGA